MRAAAAMVVLCVVLAGASWNRANLAQAQAATTGLEKLSAFQGQWTSKGQMRDSKFSKVGSNSANTTCSWSTNHGYLTCDQLVQTSDAPENDLSVYSYNEKDHSYLFFGLSRGDRDARTPRLTIDGNLWTYLGGFDQKDGKHISFRTTNTFTSPTSVVWRSEFSDDGTNWTLMGEGTETRVK
jgi:hypothetical protein